MLIGEGDETSRCDEYFFAGRCLPQDLPIERPGFHVQTPVVPYYIRLRQPERLIIDKELHNLAVRHVADGLTGLCKTVGFFPVDYWSRLIEPVNESCVLGIWTALLRAPSDAEIPIAERKH